MAAASAVADRTSDGFVDEKVNTNATGETGKGLPTRPFDRQSGQPSIQAFKEMAKEELVKEEMKKGASSDVNSQSPFPPYGLAELEADARNVQSVQEKALQETL